MISTLALALLATTGGDRQPAAFISLTPRGADGAPPRATLLEGVDAALQPTTALALRSAEQLGLDPGTLDACPRAELLACITAHVAARSTVTAAAILTVIPQGDRRHRLSLTLVDVARARDAAQAHGRDPRDPDAHAAVEDAIFARAFTLEPATLDGHSTAAVAAWVTAALRARALPEDAPPWMLPLSAIALAGLPGPMSLTVDGTARGTVAPGAHVVHELASGRHHLELSGEKYTAAEDVELRPGATTTVTLSLIARAAPEDPVRAPLLYGGAAAAAVGVALAIVSAASAASVERRCLALPGDVDATCSGLGWPGFGVDGDALPSLSSDRVSSGPPLLPIGAGLVGAGGALALLQGVLHDPERSVWIDVAIAVGAGATGVVVGALVAP